MLRTASCTAPPPKAFQAFQEIVDLDGTVRKGNLLQAGAVEIPGGLLLDGPAKARLRLTDRIDGAAYAMEITGPGGVRRILLDLSGTPLRDLPARLPALVRCALEAVGL